MPTPKDISLYQSEPSAKDITFSPADTGGATLIDKAGGIASSGDLTAAKSWEVSRVGSTDSTASTAGSDAVERTVAGALASDAAVNAPDLTTGDDFGTLDTRLAPTGLMAVEKVRTALLLSEALLTASDTKDASRFGGLGFDGALSGVFTADSQQVITKYATLASDAILLDIGPYIDKAGWPFAEMALSGAKDVTYPAPYNPWVWGRPSRDTSDFVVKFNREKNGRIRAEVGLSGSKEIGSPTGKRGSMAASASLGGALEVYDLRPIYELERRQRNQKALLLADVL